MSGRNRKLINFLKQNLERRSYINLNYELDQNGLESENVFCLKLPRYEQNKCKKYEPVLKGWCATAGRLYKNYSYEKATIKSALQKSIYLITLEKRGETLRYRFATSDETIVKKKQNKEKNNFQPSSPEENCNQPPSPSSPSSVASSGYGSINDFEAERMETDNNEPYNSSKELDEILTNSVNDYSLDELMKYIEEEVNRENLPCENHLDDILQLQNTPLDGGKLLQNICADDVTSPLNIRLDGVISQLDKVSLQAFKPESIMTQLQKPVSELKTSPVSVSERFKKYWLCTQKINIKGTLQMIFEMQIADEKSIEVDGSFVIPDGAFQPGVNYVLNKVFELNNMYFFFFSTDNA